MNYKKDLSIDECKKFIYGDKEAEYKLDWVITEMFLLLKEKTIFDVELAEKVFWERLRDLANRKINYGIKDLENNASEYAWIHNQGENGQEKYEIAKESFIEGANSVCSDMMDFIQWCLDHKTFVYDSERKFWFDSNTMKEVSLEEIVEAYYNR